MCIFAYPIVCLLTAHRIDRAMGSVPSRDGTTGMHAVVVLHNAAGKADMDTRKMFAYHRGSYLAGHTAMHRSLPLTQYM